MKKSQNPKSVERARSGDNQIVAYAATKPVALRRICSLLRELIDTALPNASSKVWHGSPVWFLEENPVVGYSATAKAVTLLFWNGRAFGEADLEPTGKHRAAQAVFVEASEVDPKVVRRWLKKAASDIFDSRAFFKKLRNARSKAQRQGSRSKSA